MRHEYRCPECLVRYPTADYECRGGWPRYPADLGRDDEHPVTRVERIPD